MEQTRELTKVELQVMNILWDLKQAFVQEIIDQMPDPKPAYTTISTFMRILVGKEFVAFETLGKSHRYYPLMTREEYMDRYLTNVQNTFFKGSFSSMLSFFARKEKLSNKQLDDVLQILKDNEPDEASFGK